MSWGKKKKKSSVRKEVHYDSEKWDFFDSFNISKVSGCSFFFVPEVTLPFSVVFLFHQSQRKTVNCVVTLGNYLEW